MRGWLIAIGFVILGAFLWASFGESVTKAVSDKLVEWRAEVSNSIQNMTAPRR